MVFDAATPVERQFRGADVHAAVELHGVDVDDLAAEPFRQVESEVGLAGRGRADHRDRSDRGHGNHIPTW